MTTVVCGCGPEHPGGVETSDCHCHNNDDIVTVSWICDEELVGPTNNTENANTENATDKTLNGNYWECIVFLDNLGLINSKDIYRARLMNCEGYDDTQDEDPYSGGNDSSTHQDFDFCQAWITYRDNCLPVPSSISSIEYNAQVTTWAGFMVDNRALFDLVIEGDCVSANIIERVLALQAELGLSDAEAEWFLRNGETLIEIQSFLENDNDSEAIITSNLFIDLAVNNLLNASLEDEYAGSNHHAILSNYENQFPEFDNFTDDFYNENLDPVFLFQILYNIECAILKQMHPEWSDTKIYWGAIKNIIKNSYHTVLDIIGLIPGAGELADFVNGVAYTLEGDGVNATFSFGSMVPFVGWGSTATKYGGVIVKYAGKAHDLKVVFKNGIATFGNSSKLRKVLDITDPLKEAHHLIPWSKNTHPLVQLSAHADDVPFHMNHPINGIPLDKYRANLPDGVHVNHPQYNTQVHNAMDEIIDQLEDVHGINIDDISPNTISAELGDFQNYLRNLIVDNPTTKINDLIINYP